MKRKAISGIVLMLLLTSMLSSALNTQTAYALATSSVSYTVFATRIGHVGDRTANGHVIQTHGHFVALPSTKVLSSNGGHEFEVRITYKGKSVVAPIWDVGPWNTKDDYWNPPQQREMWNDLPQGVPEAQAAYQDGYNGGKDQFERTVTNPAGIDLADGTFWDDLGMTDNDWVTVEFLWAPAVSVRDSSLYFMKGSNSGHPEYWHTYTHDGTPEGDYNGHTYVWTYVGGMPGNPSEPDCWAEFRPHLSQAGRYDVYARFYADPQNSRYVPHTVYYDGGSTTVEVDQYAPDYFTWRKEKLGTWDFAAGGDTRVVVTDATGEPYDGTTTLNVDTLEFVLISPTNNPPNHPTSLSQLRSDGITAIPEGGITPEATVVFKGTVSDPDGDQVRLEIELRQIGEAFTGEPTSETISDFVPSGTEVTITRYGLINADYHWQYRAKDSNGATSDWTEFGAPGNIDFTVYVNNPPNMPSDPSPSNHATGVSIYADLSWSGGDPDASDTVIYDVYFGTSLSPPLVSIGQSGTTYDPGSLSYGTTYYWKIIATDNHGASTEGLIWDFTTKSAPNGTTVSGDIIADTTWYLSESPYIVTGDVTLFLGYTLTIEPGVVVQFSDGTKLTIRGTLNAIGTESNRIVFTSIEPGTKGSWGGIDIATHLGAKASMKFASLSYAQTAIYVHLGGSGPVNIYDSMFTDNVIALGGYAGWDMIVERCIFERNTYAVTNADKRISNSLFRNNDYGLYATERISVYSSTFVENQVALYGGRGEVKNCEISNNNIGVQSFFEGFTLSQNTIKYNDVGVILGQYDTYSSPVYLNNFISNAIQVQNPAHTTFHSPGEETYTYNGKTYVNYLGNYWSDYTGSDADGDGIGDIAYIINSNKDYYPLMQRWENYFAPPPPEDQPPTCVIKLQRDGVEIDEIDVEEFFDIYVGDSTDDTGIREVRFSSDDAQDGIPTGEWTEWYDWDTSLRDWNASTKIKRWAFATGGAKEVWAEVRDDIGQTDRSYGNIFVRHVLPVPYYYQGTTEWCVPTSMSMIFKYYGQNIHSWGIAKDWGWSREVYWWESWDALSWEVSEYFNDHGLTTDTYFISPLWPIDYDDIFDTIKDWIDSDMPALLSIHSIAHAVVIVGYDITGESEKVYINDPSGALVNDEMKLSKSYPFVAIELNWNDLTEYIDWLSYLIAVGGTPRHPKGTIDVHDHGTLFYNKAGGKIYSWMYGLDKGIIWKNSSDHALALSPEDNFMFFDEIVNHMEGNQTYVFEIVFAKYDPPTTLWVPFSTLWLNVSIEGNSSKAIKVGPYSLRDLFFPGYGEYTITLRLWNETFTEMYDEVVFPSIEYSPVLTFYLDSPADLYVTDPRGLHVGVDPSTEEVVNEILAPSTRVQVLSLK